MYLWTGIKIKTFKLDSLMLFPLYLMYLKTQFNLPTLAVVVGMANNISKTLIAFGNIFPICFSLITGRVWDRGFSFSISFTQYRFHSFNSCWKVDGLGRSSLWHSNTSASLSTVHCSKMLGMILTAFIVEVTLPWNLSLSYFFNQSIKGTKTTRLR